MAKITLTENGKTTTYSKLAWNAAWSFVFICGLLIGKFYCN